MSDPKDFPYDTRLDIRFAPLEKIDVPALVAANQHPWFNQTLSRVNESVLRLGVFEPGEYHWHKHDQDDELFFVLEGKLLVDLEGRTVELGRWEGITVPKGVMHRTRAAQRCVILMMETAAIVPTGDA